MANGYLLSAAEIEAIEERAVRFGDGDQQISDIAADRAHLLRHLHALAAPADGEALGRIGWDVYRKERVHLGQGWVAWEDMDDDSRAAFIAPALHLHAIGAGSREMEIAALRGEAERERARADFFQGEHKRTLDEVKDLCDKLIEEREACAKIAETEERRLRGQYGERACNWIAERIRARKAKG